MNRQGRTPLGTTTSSSSRKARALIAAAIAVLTLVAYVSVSQHEFSLFDDGTYITENPQVRKGITWEGIVWALTTGHGGNWHPVTWVSHMLDCQLFGLNPAGHHLTSLFLHIVGTIVLFFVLHRMTDGVWQSAFVAAVFAFHPLHVESVAWAAERKDVLSGLFWMLTLFAYVRYTEHPSFLRYVPVFLLFGLGLMSKPMIVTLPFVLLLLDYWPLARYQPVSSARSKSPTSSPARLMQLVAEKIPLLLLAAGSSVATVLAQREAGAVVSGSFIPLWWRVQNAMYAYVEYVGKTFWPADLAVFYPHKENSLTTPHLVLLAAMFLAAFWISYRLRRRHQYIQVGWLWYIGTLVPVIGLVQVGGQAMADRYMYVPLVGLAIIVAWGAHRLITRLRLNRVAVTVAGLLLIALMMFRTWSQVQTWHDDIRLFTQAIHAVPNNTLAYNNLGVALQMKGRMEEAVVYYRHAVTLKNDYESAHNNLVGVLLALNRVEEAADESNRMGEILGKQGRYEAAESRLREALRLRPDLADAHNNLGIVLALQGKNDEAAKHFEETLELMPTHKDAKHNLEVVLSKTGEPFLDPAVDGGESQKPPPR